MKGKRPRADLAAYYGQLLDELAQSGLSVVKFAQEVGVSSASLYSWRRRLGHGIGPRLLEVQVAQGQAGEAAGAMTLLVGDRFRIELEHGFDEGALESVLGGLARC